MPRAKKASPKVIRKTPVVENAIPTFSFFPATFRDIRWLRNRKAVVSVLLVIVALVILIPHLVVAWVDKRPITAFDYYRTLDQKYGNDTKEQLISEKLVEDEASKRGIKADKTEIDSQIKKTEDQASGSANLDLALQQQGLTRSDFEKQVRLQILIKKMFQSEATVSSQEVDQYIEQNKDQLGEITDQSRISIEDQLKQQKLLSAFRAWLQQAQQSNRVVRL